MIKKYKIKELPDEVEIISVDDIPNINKNGFLLFCVNTRDYDRVYEYTEILGAIGEELVKNGHEKPIMVICGSDFTMDEIVKVYEDTKDENAKLSEV